MNDATNSDWQWATDGPQKEFASIFSDFRTALRGAWSTPQDDARISEAYLRWIEIAQAPWQSGELVQRAAAAHADYLSALRAATDEGRRLGSVKPAFENYVRQLSAAWSRLRPEQVTPADLAAIGQSMVWVAGLMADLQNAR